MELTFVRFFFSFYFDLFDRINLSFDSSFACPLNVAVGGSLLITSCFSLFKFFIFFPNIHYLV